MPTFAILHVDQNGTPSVVHVTDNKELAEAMYEWYKEKIRGTITLKSVGVTFHE